MATPTGDTLSTLGAYLKIHYLPKINNVAVTKSLMLMLFRGKKVLNSDSNTVIANAPSISRLPETFITGGGSGTSYIWTFPVHLEYNQGQGAREEGDYVPQVVSGQSTNSTGGIKTLMHKFQLSRLAIEQTKRNTYIAGNLIKDQMKEAASACALDLGRQLLGDGSGLIATVSGSPTGTGASTAACYTITVDSTKWLRRGMLLDAFDSSTRKTVAEGTGMIALRVYAKGDSSGLYLSTKFQAYEYGGGASTNTVFDGSSTGDGYKLYRYGNVGATAASYKEVMGIAGIIGTGAAGHATTFQGISPTTYSEWQCVSKTNSSVNRPLTMELLQETYDEHLTYSDPGANAIIMNPAIRRRYLALLLSNVRYTPFRFEGGWKVLSWSGGANEVPIFIDPNSTSNTVWFLDTNQFFIATLNDAELHFDDLAGNILQPTWPGSTGTANYEALAYQDFELGVYDRRRAGAKLGDIAES